MKFENLLAFLKETYLSDRLLLLESALHIGSPPYSQFKSENFKSENIKFKSIQDIASYVENADDVREAIDQVDWEHPPSFDLATIISSLKST